MSAKSLRRSQRRHHEVRLKNARRSYWHRLVPMTSRELGMVSRTPHPCSCWMCGNPRRILNEKSRQERSEEAILKRMPFLY